MNRNHKYFKYNEMIYSATAERLKINNLPTDSTIINNIHNTLDRLDEIRSVYNKPIIITSGYRCAELNEAVGGQWNSQHLKGEAADLKWDEDLFNLIKDNFKFDQLIQERNKSTKWLHISFKQDKSKERNQVLCINQF